MGRANDRGVGLEIKLAEAIAVNHLALSLLSADKIAANYA